MRYYLIVPIDTYDKVRPYDGYDANNELIPNPGYDFNLASRINQTFQWHTFSSPLSALRKDVNDPPKKVIIEVDYAKRVIDDSGNTVIDESFLDALVSEGIIIAYCHWPHRGDGQNRCIQCYLQQNSAEWELPD